jgi:hypothetical protein
VGAARTVLIWTVASPRRTLIYIVLRMSSRSLLAVAVAAVLIGGAGCSSKSDNTDSSSKSNGQNNTSNQTTLPECPSAATMNNELGIAYTEPISNGTAKQRNCAYTSADGQSGTAMVHFEILAAPSDFAAVKIGYGAGGRTTTDVSGLGDQAFSSVFSANSMQPNTVAALKGKLHVLVTSRASLDQEKALVAKLLG